MTFPLLQFLGIDDLSTEKLLAKSNSNIKMLVHNAYL